MGARRSACNSFRADTLVATPDGEKPISELQIGDHVLAYNPDTGTTGSYTVTAVLVHLDPTLIDLTIDGEQIETTPEHPFFTSERGRVNAGELRRGEHVRTAAGDYGTVQADVIVQRAQVMYNLTVAVAHTFFVGDGQWLVHNTGCDPAARRVKLREGTKETIQETAPKTADGDYINPNTGQVIPSEGPFDYGHKPNYEWWRSQEQARAEGWARKEVIEWENDPNHYQIEDPSTNRSHRYEEPK